MKIKEITVHSGGNIVTRVALDKELFDGDGKPVDYRVSSIRKMPFRNVIEIRFSNGHRVEYHGYQYSIS